MECSSRAHSDDGVQDRRWRCHSVRIRAIKRMPLRMNRGRPANIVTESGQGATLLPATAKMEEEKKMGVVQMMEKYCCNK